MGIWEGYLDLYKTYNQARQEGINEANFQRDQRVLDTRQQRAENLLDSGSVKTTGSLFSQEFDEQGNAINQALVDAAPRYEGGGFLNSEQDKHGQYSQGNKAKLMMGMLDAGYTAPQSANMISLFDTPTDTRTTLQQNYEYNESLPRGEAVMRDKAGNVMYERDAWGKPLPKLGPDGKPMYKMNEKGQIILDRNGDKIPIPVERMKPTANSQESLDAFRKSTAANTTITNQLAGFKNPAGTTVERDEQGNPVVIYAPGTKEHNGATGKIRAVEGAINAVQQMRNLIQKHGSELTGPTSGQMGQVYGQLLAEVAKARDMGVLQAGELEMIQGQLTDPTSWKALGTRQDTMLAQYEQLWQFLVQRYGRYGSEFKNMKIQPSIRLQSTDGGGNVKEYPNPYSIAAGQEDDYTKENTALPVIQDNAPPPPPGFVRRL